MLACAPASPTTSIQHRIYRTFQCAFWLPSEEVANASVSACSGQTIYPLENFPNIFQEPAETQIFSYEENPHDSAGRFERKTGQKQRPHSGHKTGPKSVKADCRPSYFWDQFCGQNTAAILKLLLDVRHKLCEASKQIHFNMGTHQCWPRKFAFLRLKTK